MGLPFKGVCAPLVVFHYQLEEERVITSKNLPTLSAKRRLT